MPVAQSFEGCSLSSPQGETAAYFLRHHGHFSNLSLSQSTVFSRPVPAFSFRLCLPNISSLFRLAQAGDKSNPIPYNGPRDKDSMVEFIRGNATPQPAAAAEL